MVIIAGARKLARIIEEPAAKITETGQSNMLTDHSETDQRGNSTDNRIINNRVNDLMDKLQQRRESAINSSGFLSGLGLE